MSKLAAPPEKFRGGFLQELDGRTAVATEMQARWDELTADLGGAEGLSYPKRAMAERFLWLEYWLRDQERALAEGRVEDFESAKWVQACNSLSGLAKTLGLQRVAKSGPTLASYITAEKSND